MANPSQIRQPGTSSDREAPVVVEPPPKYSSAEGPAPKSAKSESAYPPEYVMAKVRLPSGEQRDVLASAELGALIVGPVGPVMLMFGADGIVYWCKKPV